MSNKYHFDVLNCHYCKGTRQDNGSVEFGNEVKALHGLISMDMSPEGETKKLRADGIDYIVYTSNNGYSGTLNFVKIDEDFRKDCMAEAVDETTGMMYEDADAEFAPFALSGEFKGDQEGIRWIYYNCTAGRSNQKGENKDNQKEPDTEELPVTVSPLAVTIGGKETSIVRGGITKTMNATTYEQWFTKVTIPGGTAKVTIPGGTANASS